MKAPNGSYDVIIIGSGQGGNPLATTLARAGWKVAVVEDKYVGGTCVNYGCTPTKTMVASARVAYLARRAADYGVNIPSVTVDLKKVYQRKQTIVDNFRQGSQKGLESTENLDLYFGTAHFKSSQQIEIKLSNGRARIIESDKIVINTGARPRIPNIDGLEKVPFLDSTAIMELKELPEHLVVIGGGYIGLEFGQMFRRFGSRVTIIQKSSQLLTREDPDVAEAVAKILQEDGIDILFNTTINNIERLSSGEIELMVQANEKPSKIVGSHLLVAVGRIPNAESLHLQNAGIHTDKQGYVSVDEQLQTNVQGIYSIGDVKGGPAFTHISYDDYRVLRVNFLEQGNATITGRLVPYTVFIDPQLGRVGLSEKEARAQGKSYRVAILPMTHVARAIETDETRGFMKAVVDSETDQILGASILGLEGGEIMSVLQMAMMGNVPYTKIKDGTFAHPTLSESLNNLFMAIDE